MYIYIYTYIHTCIHTYILNLGLPQKSIQSDDIIFST